MYVIESEIPDLSKPRTLPRLNNLRDESDVLNIIIGRIPLG